MEGRLSSGHRYLTIICRDYGIRVALLLKDEDTFIERSCEISNLALYDGENKLLVDLNNFRNFFEIDHRFLLEN